MAWALIGTVTIGPNTTEAVVGPIEVPAFDGFEARVQLLSGPYPFQFGYGILSYRSSLGKELGSVRVWPRREPEDYLLGKGMICTDTTGVLVFEPRTWSLRWVKAGFSLVVAVYADLASDLLPADRFQAPAFTFNGAALGLVQVGDLGQLTFS